VGKLSVSKTVCIGFVFYIATAIASPAQTTFTTLVSFDGTDGSQPNNVSLVQGRDGNLYGTTAVGGANGPYGTVFEVTPEGMFTTLHSFGGSDGAFSTASLIQATDGNFYGTTEEGGDISGEYAGTVFKITPGGAVTTLHSFCAQSGCTDGYQPDAGLVQGMDGNLYGTTQGGGAYGHGTVYKITPQGTLTTIYSFCAKVDCTNGSDPNTALVQAANGNFYGFAGDTVFKITPSGKLTTILNFYGTLGLSAGLVIARDGNFYGTADSGGTSNAGAVFKMTPNGVLTTLYNFCSLPLCADGNTPYGQLIQGSDGNFYGTTREGGAKGYGTIFKIAPDGTLTTLYSFCPQAGCDDGAYPYGGLAQATDGSFYGTTWAGGIDDSGVVFRISIGLGPFVETNPTSGKTGARVIILGNNLTGSTSVTFNGTASTFTVVSSTEIQTTVPADATSGIVEVTTLKKKLKSNVKFSVTP
jgi:uncharacterized repeat protein (TIGR03803 family)